MAARKLGRTAKGDRHTPAIGITLPSEELAAVDALMAGANVKRSHVITAAIRALLALPKARIAELIAEVVRPYPAARKSAKKKAPLR